MAQVPKPALTQPEPTLFSIDLYLQQQYGRVHYIHITNDNVFDGVRCGDVLAIAQTDDQDPDSVVLVREGTHNRLRRKREIEPLLRRATMRVVGSAREHTTEILGFVVLWLKRRI